MPKGVIKKLSDRGYGFIRPDNSNQDIFFHASALTDGAAFDELEEGQEVEFDRGEAGTPKAKGDKTARPKAENIRLV